MTGSGKLADALIGFLLRILCRVYGEEISKVPKHGPLILVTNHVNFLEAPVLHRHLRPRKVIGLAKAEAWEHPILRWLFDQWEAIPIRRGEPDLTAIRRALAVLRQRGILGLAPEGTRSKHGRLQRGHPGMVTIALRSKAPLLPLAFHGGEAFHRNLRRLRRTPFHIHVGDPFRIEPPTGRITTDLRQRIADEIMYRLAALLPEEYHGEYAGPGTTTEEFLRPLEPVAEFT